MAKRNTQFGLSGAWISNLEGTQTAFLEKVDAFSISNDVTLTESKTSHGYPTQIFSGEESIPISLTVRDLSPRAYSILSGKELTNDDAQAAPTAEIYPLAGDWSAAGTTITAANVKVGTYLAIYTGGAMTFYKMAAFNSEIVKKDTSIAAIPGVAITTPPSTEGAYAVIEVYPDTTEIGTIIVGAGARPPVRVHITSDARNNNSQVITMLIPRAKFGSLPDALAMTAESPTELSGMVEYDDILGGFYQRTTLTI